MIDIKGLLSNPRAAYKSASQPGGLLAPATSMNGFLGDPRVNIGLAIAQGQPIGKAIMGGALQAKEIQKSLAPKENTVRVSKINSMVTKDFNLKQFVIITLLTSIWIHIGEIFRAMVIVFPMMKDFFADRIPIGAMEVSNALIWGLWDTILTAVLVFIFWLTANTFGNNIKSILIIKFILISF